MPPLSVLMKPASSLCNMNCEYCFYFDEASKRTQSHFGMMSEITLKNIIRKTILKAEQSITYAYQGGEPTLRGLEFFKTAIKLQKQYNRNKIQVFNALQTNGYEIDESWCEFFKQNNFLIGISIDGTQEIHDAYRHNKFGEATYEKVMLTTRLFDRYKVEYNILTVVNNTVAQNIKEIYLHYKKNGWNFQQYIPCLDPIGEVRGQNKYALTPQMFGQFMIDLFNLWYQDLKKGKQPYIRQFENYIGMLNGYSPESCDMRGICGVQTVVEADGSVYPCDFYMLDKYKLGNFNENQLETINFEREKIRFIETSTKLSNQCMGCNYLYICKGGCQRNREFNQGNYHNYLCEGYKMFFDKTLEKMKAIKI